MPLISMDAPTLQINGDDLQNLVSFIYRHERLLNEFGAVRIVLKSECKLALKKRRKDVALCPASQRIVKICKNESIYFVEKPDHTYQSTQRNILVKDEHSFWSSLSCASNERRQLNVSLLPDTSYFSQKTSRAYFDIHRLPNQSLLRLCGHHVTRQIVPCVKRAHGSGAIYPLAAARQHLFSLDYHHEGGARYWYIIPSCERNNLKTIMNQREYIACLDHEQLLIDPSILDRNNIRYHRIIQRPNEFVVLAAGVLTQSFTNGASWNESIDFALPSWAEEGHASVCAASCQCNTAHDFSSDIIDVSIFTHELIQKYIASHLSMTADPELFTLEGS